MPRPSVAHTREPRCEVAAEAHPVTDHQLGAMLGERLPDRDEGAGDVGQVDSFQMAMTPRWG